MTPGFSLRSRFRSVLFAARGVRTTLRTQHNAWIHLAATIGVVAAGVVSRLERWEWALIVLAIVSVWTAESLNTAFEFLCDVASPEVHPLVEQAKDVSAGAVLICAAGSVLVGLLVFIPHLADFVR